MSNKNKLATLQKDGNIALFGQTIVIKPIEAKELLIQLKAVLKNANGDAPSVAHTNVAKQMFDSARDGTVFTVHIPDENALYEIKQALAVNSNGIVPVIAALMEFHKNNESLNILIGRVVMGGTKYHNYTGQFAHQSHSKLRSF